MFTPWTVIAAIAADCILACLVMLLRIVFRATRQPWHWHLDRNAFVSVFVWLLSGLSEYSARENELSHRLGYYKGAPVTPTQSYLGGVVFTILGLVTVALAIVHARTTLIQCPILQHALNQARG